MFNKGDHFSSKCILQHDMGSDLIMNSEPHPNDSTIIAVGIGHFNQLLRIDRQEQS